ncbi:mRNA-binding ribosome synthesis protein nop7 [Cerrena zonata]|uniref:Pescadillo homolog n=1 Tax=Cerrena zonata TaxID=2478898 RepID=A0AAW0G104_9APHY
MAKIRRKGATGAAKNFVTRTQAVKKLQVSLADFRRLCIFKGIYPREPRNKKKANKGSTAPVTFYYTKDIQYLLHEPVLAKFREHKTFARKLQKALGRGEVGDAERLETNRPKYTLEHIIKERYPTFLDALRDLDDPLNMLFLFANMPATDKGFIIKLMLKVKKLYNDANLIYPPTIDISKLKAVGGLSSYVLKSVEQGANALLPKEKQPQEEESSNVPETKLSNAEISKALEADKEEDQNEESEVNENVEEIELDEFASTNKTTGDLLSQPSKYASPTSTLFSKFIFYVGREVPLDILEFCILSAGGSLISEIALDDLQINHPESFKKLDLSKITHQIVDRPKINSKVAGRTYVQPQWIFDSINKSELLPVNQYAPGETLPPHLSPWGDAGGYDPNAKPTEVADDVEDEDEEEAEVAEEDVDQDEDEEDEDLKAQKELEAEAAGVKFSDTKETKQKNGGKKRSAEDEEKELKKIMMTNKQRKLYKKMQYGIDKKEARQDDLAKKRRKIDKTKAELEKLNKKNN